MNQKKKKIDEASPVPLSGRADGGTSPEEALSQGLSDLVDAQTRFLRLLARHVAASLRTEDSFSTAP